MKSIVAMLLLVGSSAVACPNLNGVFKGQEPGETIEYKQLSCEELQLIGYIDGEEYASKTFKTDGSVVENVFTDMIEKLTCSYSTDALNCKSELFDDQNALIDTLETKEFINASNNMQMDFVYFTAEGDKEVGTSEMERVSP